VTNAKPASSPSASMISLTSASDSTPAVIDDDQPHRTLWPSGSQSTASTRPVHPPPRAS
jgi:hypothetical protein